MKNFSKLIAAFVMLVGLGACQHKYPTCLVEVDSLMSSNPKLALDKLNALSCRIDTSNNDDLMYFRLLRMSIMDKLYMSHYKLLEAKSLVEYYKSKNDAKLLPRAYYILGRVQSDLGDVSKALSSFHKVLDCLGGDDNLKLRAITNAQLGEIFAKQENFVSALKFYKEAYRCDSLQNDKKGQLFDLRDIALSYDYLGKAANARVILNKSIQLAQLEKDQAVLSEMALAMANSYLEVNNDSVDKYLLLSLRNSKENSDNYLYVKSVYFQVQEEGDSAVYYLQKMLKNTKKAVREDVLKRLVTLSLERKNLDDAYYYYDLLLDCSDSLSLDDNNLKEEKDMALYNYVYQVENGRKLEKANNQKAGFLVVMSLVLVMIIITFWFYCQMDVVKKIKLQKRIKDWMTTSVYVDRKQKEKDRIRECLDLDRLADAKKYLTKDNLLCLASMVEEAYPNFKAMKSSCADISEHEYHICLLVKIGMTTSKIAILLNRAPSTISTAKQRLYKKLAKEKGNAEQFDKLIDAF